MSDALKLAHNALTFAKPMIGALCADSPTAGVREKRNKVYAKVEAALAAVVAELAKPAVACVPDQPCPTCQQQVRW